MYIIWNRTCIFSSVSYYQDVYYSNFLCMVTRANNVSTGGRSRRILGFKASLRHTVRLFLTVITRPCPATEQFYDLNLFTPLHQREDQSSDFYQFQINFAHIFHFNITYIIFTSVYSTCVCEIHSSVHSTSVFYINKSI